MNKYKVLEEIAKKCKEKREEMKVTQESIGKLAGVTRSCVSQFENGKIDSEILLYYYIIITGVKL